MDVDSTTNSQVFWTFILLLCFACFDFPYFATARRSTGNETDRLSLLEFKAKITEDPFGVLSSWNESYNFCQWHGVTCGRLHQRVTKLDLASSKLTGSISPYIGNLSFLRRLTLQNNSLINEIPPEIGNLRRMRLLRLSNNSLVGKIPRHLSHCSNLVFFALSDNDLIGEIPEELASLSRLRLIFTDKNSLTGELPSSLGNLSSLMVISMSYNELNGGIPDSLGLLINLKYISLGGNQLSGTIPPNIFNLSNIVLFNVQDNKLRGILPSNLSDTFPNLYSFNIDNNKFTGSIPVSFSNASKLINFEVAQNEFTGKVPSLGNSGKLSTLVLSRNQLGTGGKFNDLSFFSSLINCTNLDVLNLNDNNFGGILSESFFNLSTTLSILFLSKNPISGHIPSGIGKFVNLGDLRMGANRLSGNIPLEIGKLENLQNLDLPYNEFSGNIPASLGNLSLLLKLRLFSNRFHGDIPSSLGNCTNLIVLELFRCNLSGPIPPQIFGLSSLDLALDLSENHLTGSLPTEVGNLKNLGILDVSYNMLSSDIPSTLASCVRLEILNIAGNFFHGTIPLSLSSLRGLQFLDLSHNNLSGPIPDYFGEFGLQYLNLSFNGFEGELPEKGIFKNASAVFVSANTRLCGGIHELNLPLCIFKGYKKKRSIITYKLLVPVILGLLVLTLALGLLLFRWLKKKRRQPTSESPEYSLFRVSYQDLVKATDGFSSANVIGHGGFGTVYAGILEDGKRIAVKVLKLQHRKAARSFMAECEALRNARHRNLAKVLTACSGVDYQGNDFKAIVYEFMVNGTLDDWLHPVPREDEARDQPNQLNLLERLNIAIDVASALNYLHNDCEPPIVHCDIKPSNILLDNEMTGHVGDFGLARFVMEASDNDHANQSSSDGVKGSIGYIPPEYGVGSEMSISGDVYSFGILLLEMITRKRPTDNMFHEGQNLHTFSQMALAHQVIDIIDTILLNDNAEEVETAVRITEKELECLISVIKIGVACSVDSPQERKSINDVLRELQIAREYGLGSEMRTNGDVQFQDFVVGDDNRKETN